MSNKKFYVYVDGRRSRDRSCSSEQAKLLAINALSYYLGNLENEGVRIVIEIQEKK